MNLTSTQSRIKICTVLAMAVTGCVLAGCTHTAPPVNTGPAQLVAHETPPPSSGGPTLDDKSCATSLTIGRSDDGRTFCVRLGAQVTVGYVSQNPMMYAQITQVGTSLTLQPLPMPFGLFAYKATSRGTTVLSGSNYVCFSSAGTAPSCPHMAPWSVTIVVR
jgi:hypothetical protein